MLESKDTGTVGEGRNAYAGDAAASRPSRAMGRYIVANALLVKKRPAIVTAMMTFVGRLRILKHLDTL